MLSEVHVPCRGHRKYVLSMLACPNPVLSDRLHPLEGSSGTGSQIQIVSRNHCWRSLFPFFSHVSSRPLLSFESYITCLLLATLKFWRCNSNSYIPMQQCPKSLQASTTRSKRLFKGNCHMQKMFWMLFSFGYRPYWWRTVWAREVVKVRGLKETLGSQESRAARQVISVHAGMLCRNI